MGKSLLDFLLSTQIPRPPSGTRLVGIICGYLKNLPVVPARGEKKKKTSAIFTFFASHQQCRNVILLLATDNPTLISEPELSGLGIWVFPAR